MEGIFSLLIGILLGSFPTAYLILKKYRNIDITENGSGSVGAMNSFRLSKSKILAFSVFLVDFLKGLLTVYLIELIFGDFFVLKMMGLIGAVLGHCFSFWIKFKGGRGLATTAGGAVLISYPLVGIWVIMWLIAFAFRRSIHFANFAASLLTALLALTSADILNKYTYPSADTNFEFSLTVVFLLIIILIKHIEPMKVYIKQQAEKSRKD